MTRIAIYARYSSDLQKDRSIEDQFALCRQYAGREGLEVVATYEDRALTGGSVLGRDGIAHMLRDAAEGRFEVVIVEALDRLSRDMADLATIYKRLTFYQVQIIAVHEGLANEMAVALRGLLGQLFRKDLKDKVKRGQAGRVRAGMVAAGLAYGYAPVPGRPGERTIVPEEAEIVRRIFREFADGRAPRTIAKGLNADGICPPQGRSWCASTLYGGPKRGGGLLRNEVYAGRLVWNRVPELRDPETNKRTTRPSRPEERVTAEVPHLAIIEKELWDAVCARFDAAIPRNKPVNRKRSSILSGLLRCPACGAGMSSRGKCRHGRPRIGCSRQVESGDCPAPQTLYLDTIEAIVLAGLKSELIKSSAFDEFLQAYRAERERLMAGANQRIGKIKRRLSDIARELDRITDYLVRGIGDEGRLDLRAKELAAEERKLQDDAALIPQMSKPIELNTQLFERYRSEILQLEKGLADRMNRAESPAASAIREMIDRVTPRRDPDTDEIIVEIEGTLPILAMEDHAMRVGGSDGGPGGTRTPNQTVMSNSEPLIFTDISAQMQETFREHRTRHGSNRFNGPLTRCSKHQMMIWYRMPCPIGHIALAL